MLILKELELKYSKLDDHLSDNIVATCEQTHEVFFELLHFNFRHFQLHTFKLLKY